MTERRLDVRAVAALILAGAFAALADRLKAGIGIGHVPLIGAPLLLLCLRALALVILVSALWRLRPLFGAAFNSVLLRFDAAEARLFAQLAPSFAPALRALLLGLVIGSVASLLVETSNFEQGLEASFIDRWFSLRFPQRSSSEVLIGASASGAVRRDEVVIVALDDDTVAHLGWPLPRRAYARLIDRVSSMHPRSLSFDLSIIDASREHPEWDAEVGAAAARAGNVFFSYVLAVASRDAGAQPSEAAQRVLSANTIPWHDEAQWLPDFASLTGHSVAPKMVIDSIAAQAHGTAMTNVVLDGNDDILRRSLLVARLGQQLYPALCLRIAADGLGVPLSQIRIHRGGYVDIGGKRRVPINEFGQTLVRYQGRNSQAGDGPFRHVSMWSLLRAEDSVTLADSPMGEDQEFIIDEQTRDPEQLAQRLSVGAAIAGVADYTSEPGRILELATPGAKSADEAGFTVLDEARMRFSTRLRSLRPRGVQPPVLAGRHVLVGSTALAASDVHTGPLGLIAGVEYQATMLSNLLRGDFFHTAPLGARVALTVLLGILAALIGSLCRPSLGIILVTLLAMAAAIGVFLSFGSGLYMPSVAPAGALILSYSLCVLLSFRAEGKARARAEEGRELVRRTFGRYLTEQVVQEILDSPDGLKLGGQRRFVTLMMTDLRGFTTMCSAMEPEDVVRLLNHYLEAMTGIITRYGGTIDEFIGDAILVVFGAPLKHSDQGLRAVACAIEMLNAMAAVNGWNRSQRLPAVEMGIGLHSGEVVLGNIGSELRAKYGIVGTIINVTSRIESYTVGGQVLISEATRQICGDQLIVGASQSVTPKGVAGSLTIHEALAVEAPFHVKLDVAAETFSTPQPSLEVRYAVIRDKQVGALTERATVEALSKSGLELRLHSDPGVAVLTNLQLQLIAEDGEPLPGEIYGKILRVNVRPGVIYVRVTSASADARARLEKAISAC